MKRRAELTDEVKAAVDDLLNGTDVDSHTAWLQRQYIRLMKRECGREREKKIESNLTEKLDKEEKDGVSTEQDRSAE